jgi:EAL domain-containing protein (putative c-di-GMP-specific phosphodiesterase class I)
MAYEALGRGAQEGIPESPFPLFQLAESLDREVELSELFRFRAVEKAIELGASLPLYLNTHPREMLDIDRLAAHLSELRRIAPDLPIVIEIHEEGVTSKAAMEEFQAALGKTYCKFAFDDFGAGRARLLELIEIPPALVKFDVSLLRDIDQASEAHLSLMESLVSLSKTVGSQTLAEGIETEAEFRMCAKLGIDLIQGYYLGRPQPDFQINPDNPV